VRMDGSHVITVFMGLIAILVIGGWIGWTVTITLPLKPIEGKEEANRNEA